MAPRLEAFDHVHVVVADGVWAAAWCHEVLGLARVAELAQWAADDGPLMVRDRPGGVMLALFEGSPAPSRSTVAFRVDAPGFERWRSHLAAVAPGAVRCSDHGAAVSLYVEDPFGNPFEITCYADDAGV